MSPVTCYRESSETHPCFALPEKNNVTRALLFLCFVSACAESVPPVDVAQDVTTPKDTAPEYSCDPFVVGTYSQPPGHDCHVRMQECTAPGEACYFTEEGASCLPTGLSGCGQRCEFANDCPEGTVCIGEPGYCMGLCNEGQPCANDTTCRGFGDVEALGYCPKRCSILEQDCPIGLGCFLVNGQEECAPVLSPSFKQNQVCESANRCQLGLICHELDVQRCLKACEVNNPDYGCETGVCVPLEDLDGLGVCLDQEED